MHISVTAMATDSAVIALSAQLQLYRDMHIAVTLM